MKVLQCHLFTIVGVLLFYHPAIAQVDQSAVFYSNNEYSKKIEEAQKFVSDLIIEKNIPGLSITIATKDEVIWAESFGFADLENNVPAKLNTKFRIGSISKTLTGIAIGKLMEENRLNLNDPVQKYVPYFPEKKWEITIGGLVSHTAGIRDYNYRNGEFLNRSDFKSIEESVNVFKNDSLLFEPGTKYSYSTYGYVLLSAVIEGASGMDYLVFMQDSVLSPMNLKNTVPDVNARIISNKSRFYDESDGEIVNGYYVNNSNKWAGGGYLSTSYDLALFSQNLLNNQFISESTKELLWTPASLNNGEKTNYGIGWRIDIDDKGRKYVHHGGSSIGGRSFLLVYPNEELVIAITCNLSTNFDQYSLFKIVELFIE
ncbi:MAG: beta-lactamase family protein [Phaeodactylibacter sp.]|nr:beta-lactamase family protein [Phaeodactylibacter sp.]